MAARDKKEERKNERGRNWMKKNDESHEKKEAHKKIRRGGGKEREWEERESPRILMALIAGHQKSSRIQ